MPLASAWPLRSVAIGAGVGGRVSHRSRRERRQGGEGEKGGECELAHGRSWEGLVNCRLIARACDARPDPLGRRTPSRRRHIDIGRGSRRAQPILHDRTFDPSVEEFIALLKDADINLLVDVRTVPRSRTNPQFNSDALPASLAAHGVAYEHVAALGGLRGKQRGVSPDVNAFWENAGFHNYADYAMSEEFRSSLENCAR